MYIGTCGPGTFVTTMLNGSSRVALRAPSASSVDGVHSAACVSTSAPTALLRLLQLARCARRSRSSCCARIGLADRQRRRSTPRRGCRARPRSSSLRTLTGAITRKSRPVGRHAAALEEAAHRAGHDGEHDVVQRAAERLAHRLDRRRASIASQSKRRCGPIGRLSGVVRRRGAASRRASRRPRAARTSDLARASSASRTKLAHVAQRGERQRARGASTRGAAARGPTAPAAARSGTGSGMSAVGRRAHQHVQQVDARDAVDHAVVRPSRSARSGRPRGPRRSTSPRAGARGRGAAA